MRSSRNGEVVQAIEKELSLGGRMAVSSAMLLAHHYGVPQKRQRLFFVGLLGNAKFDFGTVRATHGPETGRSYVTVGEALGDLPSIRSGQSKRRYATPPQNDYQELMRVECGTILFNHEAPNHPPETVEKIRSTMPGSPMYPQFRQRIRLSWDDLSPTQVSGGIRPQFQFGHPRDARGLTIRERCRLQSFPDRFIVSGGIVQGRVQTGNAVPPLLAKALALAIRSRL